MRKKLLIVFMIVSIGTLVFAGAVYDRADAPLSVELAGVFSTTEEPVVENKPEPIPEEPVSVSEELLPVSKELPWNLMLVNQTHLLGEEFVPECGTLSNGYEVDARIVDAVDTMLSDAKAAGHSVWCTSGYRSYALQEELFQNKVSRVEQSEGLTGEDAVSKAKTVVAMPGSSEHQTGLAVDLVCGSFAALEEEIAETEELKWIAEHCAEYGFILRYPKETIGITGIIYEPWHFRYVGKEAAAVITKESITLEEYLQREYGVE